VPGIEYALRPGGYAVIFNDAGEVAAVKTPTGWMLPGGGADERESLEAAALREVGEECGLQIALGQRIGTADELVKARSDGNYYRKRCTFWIAEVVGAEGDGEDDHQLAWLTPRDALKMLLDGSQRWAVAEACRLLQREV
jgi:8-oxo-dGTP diphosphatase